MTVRIPWNFGRGGTGIERKAKQILNSLADDDLLAYVNVNAVTGAAANAQITLTGITTSDKVLFAIINHGMKAATPAYVSTDIAATGEISIPVAGKVKLTFDTTNAEVFVVWVDKSAKGTQKHNE